MHGRVWLTGDNWPTGPFSASSGIRTEFGGTYKVTHCNCMFMVIMFMSLQNSWGPYNTATLYRSVERIVGHSVTWVCERAGVVCNGVLRLRGTIDSKVVHNAGQRVWSVGSDRDEGEED